MNLRPSVAAILACMAANVLTSCATSPASHGSSAGREELADRALAMYEKEIRRGVPPDEAKKHVDVYLKSQLGAGRKKS